MNSSGTSSTPSTPIVTISYRPEWTDRGWVIWRKAGTDREVALRPRPQSRDELAGRIRDAHRADSAACSRLGLACVAAANGTDLEVYALPAG